MGAKAISGVVVAACVFSAALIKAALAGDASTAPAAGAPPGYLSNGELPDSLALLPPPPALGSPAEALDQDIARTALGMQGTERFALAALDADLTFPTAAGTFSCALGVAVAEDSAPTLYRLLRRVLADAGAATGATKDKYRHARPFMLDGQPTCQPSAEQGLRSSGSYPSGHTSIGWAWAEVLAELAPDRADALLRRGRAFGESRIVCNAHWASDVVEGRTVGAATVVLLHANADFLADLQKAKAELTDLRLKNLPPQRDCEVEKRALGQTRWLTP
jgi:acid phosphatase (class A)